MLHHPHRTGNHINSYFQPWQSQERRIMNGRAKNSFQSPSPYGHKTTDGLTKTLQYIQQISQVVQQTTPFVQQYGPIIKDLPKLYRMLKALNEDDPNSENHINDQTVNNKEENKRVATAGKSTPKLYI